MQLPSKLVLSLTVMSPIVPHSPRSQDYNIYIYYNMYFSLRLTQTPDISGNDIFRKMILLYNIKNYALCFEILDKYLEPTLPHWHLNFIAVAKKTTIQEWLNKRGIKTNAMYALSSYSLPDNVTRWWRYTMKENLLESNLDASFNINNMTLIAKDERKRASIFNIAKRASKEERSTLYQKIEVLLKKKHVMNPHAVFKFILNYYLENNMSVNPNTIKGYTHLYLLKEGIIPIDDYVTQYYN